MTIINMLGKDFNQINQSRKQIAEGKSKKFKNADEYLKSLDADA